MMKKHLEARNNVNVIKQLIHWLTQVKSDADIILLLPTCQKTSLKPDGWLRVLLLVISVRSKSLSHYQIPPVQAGTKLHLSLHRNHTIIHNMQISAHPQIFLPSYL